MADRSVEELLATLTVAEQYPHNLLACREFEHTVKTVSDQLSKRSRKLFCPEPDQIAASKAALVFWDLFGETEGFVHRVVRDGSTLERHLRAPVDQRRPDPQQRMVFVHARHSRANLQVSRKMLMQLLTYHNVMPTFLEFVFPFGQQHFARDFHLMGFRSQSQMSRQLPGLRIDALGRSGRHLEFCYSLKSVESSSEVPLPWSIRQCSVYHHLDLETGQANWIVVKANRVISDAMQRRSKDDHETQLISPDDKPSPLATSIELHKIVCSWISDNWHWYINDLETYLQDKTRRAISSSAEPLAMFSANASSNLAPAQTTPSPTPPPPHMAAPKRAWSWRSVRARTLTGSTFSEAAVSMPLQAIPSTGAQDSTGFGEFSFRDLQNVQFVEERANEALLVLGNDVSALNDIVEEYRRLAAAFRKEPSPLQGDHETAIAGLEQQIFRIEKYLTMQMARLKTLLSVTADRKSLLIGLLQYRSVQASEFYAEKAYASAQRMEVLTDAMYDIAEKTRVETVSMRIITWVTLCFLPGTFISTLMSTPIVDFHGGGADVSFENIGVGALKLYLAVSLPLVLLTFIAYWIFKYNARRKQRRKALDTAEKTNV